MKGENGVEKIMLQEATTLELVRELTQREGVEVNTVGHLHLSFLRQMAL